MWAHTLEYIAMLGDYGNALRPSVSQSVCNSLCSGYITYLCIDGLPYN